MNIENLTVTVSTKSKGTAELSLSIAAAEFDRFVERALTRIGNTITVDGFRKGKVPANVVREKVGSKEVMEEAAEELVPMAYAQAVDQQNLSTIGSPTIEVTKMAEGNPFEFKATVALVPDVTVGDLSQLKVEAKPVEVKDEDVQKTIDQLRDLRRTELASVEPAKKGDKVEIDLDIFRDGVPMEGGSSKAHPVVIGDSNFIPGFEDNLIGLKPGDNKTFTLKFPAEYHQKNLAGQEAEFRVKATNVLTLNKPEFNDAFAQQVGDFKTTKDLEEKIRQNITEDRTKREQQRHEQALLDALIDASKFGDIPELLVKEEIDRMVEELEHDISHQGMKFDDYLSSIKKTRDSLKLEFTPSAMKRVKSALLTRAIAKQESISATPEEVTEERTKWLKQYEAEGHGTGNLDMAELNRYLGSLITNRKVLALIKERAGKSLPDK